MVEYINECVGCTSIGLRCIGSTCPNRSVKHIICDKCGAEDKIYQYGAEQLCIDCIEETLTEVEQ